MNSYRKIIFTLFIMITLNNNCINSMELPVAHTSENTLHRDLVLVGAGFAAGFICAGGYCWYIHHTNRLTALEEQFKNLKQDHKRLSAQTKRIKQTQDEETTRLNQARAWILDNIEKQAVLTEYYAQLNRRINILEDDGELFISAEGSSSNDCDGE